MYFNIIYLARKNAKYLIAVDKSIRAKKRFIYYITNINSKEQIKTVENYNLAFNNSINCFKSSISFNCNVIIN